MDYIEKLFDAQEFNSKLGNIKIDKMTLFLLFSNKANSESRKSFFINSVNSIISNRGSVSILIGSDNKTEVVNNLETEIRNAGENHIGVDNLYQFNLCYVIFDDSDTCSEFIDIRNNIQKTFFELEYDVSAKQFLIFTDNNSNNFSRDKWIDIFRTDTIGHTNKEAIGILSARNENNFAVSEQTLIHSITMFELLFLNPQKENLKGDLRVDKLISVPDKLDKEAFYTLKVATVKNPRMLRILKLIKGLIEKTLRFEHIDHKESISKFALPYVKDKLLLLPQKDGQVSLHPVLSVLSPYNDETMDEFKSRLRAFVGNAYSKHLKIIDIKEEEFTDVMKSFLYEFIIRGHSDDEPLNKFRKFLSLDKSKRKELSGSIETPAMYEINRFYAKGVSKETEDTYFSCLDALKTEIVNFGNSFVVSFYNDSRFSGTLEKWNKAEEKIKSLMNEIDDKMNKITKQADFDFKFTNDPDIKRLEEFFNDDEYKTYSKNFCLLYCDLILSEESANDSVIISELLKITKDEVEKLITPLSDAEYLDLLSNECMDATSYNAKKHIETLNNSLLFPLGLTNSIQNEERNVLIAGNRTNALISAWEKQSSRINIKHYLDINDNNQIVFLTLSTMFNSEGIKGLEFKSE